MVFGLSKALQYLAVIPSVIQLVFALVHLFEVEGNGAAKKDAVLETVKVAYQQVAAAVNLKVSEDFVLKVAEGTITVAVNFYNLVGVFKKDK